MTTIDRQSAFSGTREVAERLRFDVARLEDYLSAHVAGFAGPGGKRNGKRAVCTSTVLLSAVDFA